MMQFFSRGWFLVALVSVLLAGLLWPFQLEDIADGVPKPPLVAFVLFLMSVTLDSSMVSRALRSPKAVVLATFINYGLLPLSAWFVAMGLSSNPGLALGLVIVASAPSSLASGAIWTRRAGGNDAVALLVTMVTNFSCFLMTPMLINLLSGKSVSFNPEFMFKIMINLMLVVLLPIFIGQLLRRFKLLGRQATKHKKTLGTLAQCGILAVVLVGSVECGKTLSEGAARDSLGLWTWCIMLSSVIGIHTAMLFAGHLLGKLWNIPREERIAIGFSGSQKTLMIPVYLAVQFKDLGIVGLAMLPIVAYHFCQLTIDTLVADWLNKGRDSGGHKEAETVNTAEKSHPSGSLKTTEIAEPAKDPEPPQDE